MIVGFVGAGPSSDKQGTTVQNSPFFPSLHNALGKTQKTNGSRTSSGIASRLYGMRPSCKRNTTIAMPIRGLLQARGPSHMGQCQSWHNLTARPTSGHLVLLLRLQRPQGFRDFY